MVRKKSELQVEMRNEMRGGKKQVEITQLEKELLPPTGRLFAQIRLIPGASIGYHVHENEAEMFYFIQGSGIVLDDDNEVLVAAGDVMTTMSGHGHSVENTGDVDLILVASIIKETI